MKLIIKCLFYLCFLSTFFEGCWTLNYISSRFKYKKKFFSLPNENSLFFFPIIKQQREWPDSLIESFSKANQHFNEIPNYCENNSENCRSWATIKNLVFSMLNHFEFSKGNSLFYVETQKKTNNLKDYGQFLFAVIPNNLKTSPVERNLILTFFTLCIPIDKRKFSFLDHKCPLDSCRKLLSKPKECDFIMDKKNIKIAFHSQQETAENINF